MKTTHFFYIIFLIVLTSCAGNLSEKQKELDKFYGECDNPSRPMTKVDYNICKAKEKAKTNDKEKISLSGIFSKSDKTTTVIGMPVNQDLWRASLKIVDSYPLKIVDSQGGYIETDWISDTNIKDQRCVIKINIYSSELVSNGVESKIICQQSINGNWQNQTEDIVASQKLTLKILQTAQNLNL